MPLFYYDEDGYQVQHEVEAANATGVAPPTEIPEGKVARWLDDHWEVTDPASASGNAGGSSTTATLMENLAQAITYNGDGTVNTITAGPDAGGSSYVQTFGYTAGKLTSISEWVKQ